MSKLPATPKHVGIIMDGNRRWAKQRGLPSLRGHAKGQQVLYEITRHAFNRGVRYLTVYAFSTENWQRSSQEVTYLVRRFGMAITKHLQPFIDNNLKMVFLGSRSGLDVKLLDIMDKAEAATAGNTDATLAICLNYGGLQEIADAAKQLVVQGTPAGDITPELLAGQLYHPDIPPIDLLIRTGGEQRLSNFMLWRASYSELVFSSTYWPDFTTNELDEILVTYTQRQRRFGK